MAKNIKNYSPRDIIHEEGLEKKSPSQVKRILNTFKFSKDIKSKIADYLGSAAYMGHLPGEGLGGGGGGPGGGGPIKINNKQRGAAGGFYLMAARYAEDSGKKGKFLKKSADFLGGSGLQKKQENYMENL